MRSSMLRAAAITALLAVGAGAGIAIGSDGGASGHKALFAVLNGRNELNATTLKRGAGDLNGRGSATVLIDGTTVCFGITVTNLSMPVGAHIHKGTRKKNGSIVVPLTQPATGDPGASSGCVTGVDAALARDIQRHPARYYVNVHTTEFGGGAIRGQLFPPHR